MYRYFERLVDPFPPAQPTVPPRRLWAFLLHYSRPVLPWLLLMSLLTGTLAALEVVFFGYLGSLVDWLAAADRSTFFTDHGGRLLGMALVIVLQRGRLRRERPPAPQVRPA